MRVPRSLRSRLLLATIAVALVALVVADFVVYASLRSFLYEQVDNSLTASQLAIEHSMSRPPGLGEHNPPANENPPSLQPGGQTHPSPSDFCTLVAQSAPGMFVEVRTPSGTVIASQTCAAHRAGGTSEAPRLPKTGQPAAAQFLSAPSTTSGGPQFEVLVSHLSPQSELVVGMPVNALLSTLQQLEIVEIAVTAAALVTALLLGWWLVRLGLRPLVEVERTASAIAAGDLSRRVPGGEERTEVGRVAAALNAMLERIDAAFTERDRTESALRDSETRLRQFVADASHELRTPIAAVSAYAELFERGAATRQADLERVISGIGKATSRMTRLVEDLLLLARLDEHLSTPSERVELVGLVAEAIDTARTVGPGWPITFRASEPVEVNGDTKTLRQVIDNLLANVRAHTPAGTETIVDVRTEDSLAIIDVIDDGPGLVPGEEGRVFERFVRADASRSRETGGSGLGLSIVHSIVAAHHGQVQAIAHVGGAFFRVSIPTAPPEMHET